MCAILTNGHSLWALPNFINIPNLLIYNPRI